MLVGVLREIQARGIAETLCFTIMPDHCHWLLRLIGTKTLSATLAAMKSITAHRYGGPLWQDGFHDRALRSEEDLVSVARYIVANPLRAGLVQRIGDYPHWDAVWL